MWSEPVQNSSDVETKSHVVLLVSKTDGACPPPAGAPPTQHCRVASLPITGASPW
jgi:hypothetical protein